MASTGSPKRADGRSARWNRHNAERRDQIIEAAIALVEELPPGEDIHIHQIADRAGMVRTVVYRHFDDRSDLDAAVQLRVIDMIRAAIEPAVSLEGSIDDIILRIVSSYVEWAATHPNLNRLAARDNQVTSPALQQTIGGIAEQIESLFTTVMALLDLDLGADDTAALDPLVFGLVGEVFAAVQRWQQRETQEPSGPVLARFLTRSIWLQIDGHARDRGLELEPDVRLDQMLGLDELD